MPNGERLRVSRPRKKAFLAALTDYMAAGPRSGATPGTAPSGTSPTASAGAAQ